MSGAIKLPSAIQPPPAAPAPAAGGGLGSLASNKNLLMVGGAAVVAVVALISSKRAPAPDPGPESFEIDTRDTDLYNDLQPELEQISDRLSGIEKPVTPAPPVVKPPTTPPPAPKPVKTGYSNHTVLKGQGLAQVAAIYGTTQGRVYASNVIGRRRADGSMGVLRYYKDVKPGVRLVIPTAIKNNQS
jgi:hypothetical protein